MRGAGAAPDLGAGTTFVLLRHGETALTAQGRFSGGGGPGPELSGDGRRQAERAAAAIAGRGAVAPVQAVLTSPLVRCRQTAEAVADRLGLQPRDVAVEDGLRETDFGEWEGLTFAEARARQPAALDAWLASSATAPPGGESFDAVADRVARTRDGLLARHRGRTLLLVTHATPAKSLILRALGAPPEALFRLALAPASLSALTYYADGNAVVEAVNSTAHLR